MFGLNPEAWLALHRQEHARQMAEALTTATPAVALPSLPAIVAPACATC